MHLRRTGSDAMRLAVKALAEGARHALPVAIACTLVGVIIGVINLTGVAAEFGGHIIAIGEKSLLAALMPTMLTCLVLGMGIPDDPQRHHHEFARSAGAAAAGRAADRLAHVRLLLRDHGRPDAAGGAGRVRRVADREGNGAEDQHAGAASRDRRIHHPVHGGLTSPALMMQGDSWLATIYVVIKALIAIGLWGCGAIGFGAFEAELDRAAMGDRSGVVPRRCAADDRRDRAGCDRGLRRLAPGGAAARRRAAPRRGAWNGGAARHLPGAGRVAPAMAAVAATPRRSSSRAAPRHAGVDAFDRTRCAGKRTTRSTTRATAEPPELWAVASRVRGSGAGMEPGPGAVLKDGWYHDQPARRDHPQLWLTRSDYTADYELCIDGGACRTMAHGCPPTAGGRGMWACRDGP